MTSLKNSIQSEKEQQNGSSNQMGSGEGIPKFIDYEDSVEKRGIVERDTSQSIFCKLKDKVKIKNIRRMLYYIIWIIILSLSIKTFLFKNQPNSTVTGDATPTSGENLINNLISLQSKLLPLEAETLLPFHVSLSPNYTDGI